MQSLIAAALGALDLINVTAGQQFSSMVMYIIFALGFYFLMSKRDYTMVAMQLGMAHKQLLPQLST